MFNKQILHISRPNQQVNKSRAYFIYINNKKVGSISNGETKEFQINTANCSIYAKIDWCKTEPLTIKFDDKSIQSIVIGCNVKRRSENLMTAISTLAYGLYGVYWVFFKPSKYLYIKEKK